MRPEPLVLSEEQLAAVMTAANAVPPSGRDRYLALVADRLLGQPLTNDAIVSVTHDVQVALITGGIDNG